MKKRRLSKYCRPEELRMSDSEHSRFLRYVSLLQILIYNSEKFLQEKDPSYLKKKESLQIENLLLRLKQEIKTQKDVPTSRDLRQRETPWEREARLLAHDHLVRFKKRLEKMDEFLKNNKKKDK